MNGCLRAVGRVVVDETPSNNVGDGGHIACLNLYNPELDELIVPPDSACLNQRYVGDCSDERPSKS